MGPTLSRQSDKRVRLYEAIHMNDLDLVAVLIKEGVDISSAFFTGYSPLVTACLEARTDIFKLLLENHADIKTRTSFGLTIYHYVHMCENSELVQILEEHRNLKKNKLKKLIRRISSP